MVAAAFGGAGVLAILIGLAVMFIGLVLICLGSHWVCIAYAILTQN